LPMSVAGSLFSWARKRLGGRFRVRPRFCALLGMAQTFLASGQVQEAWISRYNSTNNGAYALTVDDVGNVYIAGFAPSTNASSTRFPNTDILTVKYDAEGNQVWEARFEGYRTNACEAYGVGVDRAGNVCVTGIVRAGGNNYS